MPVSDVEQPPAAPGPIGGPPGAGPSTAFLLQATGRIVRERIEERLRAHDTSLRQMSALGHLRHSPGLSYSDLARRAGITVQSMQATVEQLQARGLVERATLPGRGRLAELHVTPAGLALLRRSEEAVDEVSEELLALLPAADRQVLPPVLSRLFAALVSGGTPTAES